MTTYGYIGLGTMGSAMAENLISSGTPVFVYDINANAVASAVQQGATEAASPAEVAAVSDVVSICVPASEHIESVMTGPGGIVESVAEGKHDGLHIVIHSTVHPDTMMWARDTAAEWGVPLFDACVAGGADNARAGTQMVLAGGVDEMPDVVSELLAIYARTIVAAGPVGAGAAMKIAFNLMTYAQFAAAATSHDLLTSAGGNPKELLAAWKDAGQLGVLTEQFAGLLGVPAEHISGDFRSMLETQVGISQKDLSLAMALGQSRPGTDEFIRTIHDAMPEIYGVASEENS